MHGPTQSKGRLYSTEWNSGMERWNGMEWNDYAYTIVNGSLPRCAHAQQIDNGLFFPHTNKGLTAALLTGQGDRAGRLTVCTL